jgi:hypothetical protein
VKEAVRFSLYAPILMIAANLVLGKPPGANHPGAKAFALVSVLMIAPGSLTQAATPSPANWTRGCWACKRGPA